MRLLNYNQVGYGQYNVHYECEACGEQDYEHVTGHGYEEHHSDCEYSHQTNFYENLVAEIKCEWCGHVEEEPETYECRCEEYRARDEEMRLEQMTDKERAEIEAEQLELERYEERLIKIETLLDERCGIRPEGLTHSSAVKNWRTKRSKERAKIELELKEAI